MLQFDELHKTIDEDDNSVNYPVKHIKISKANCCILQTMSEEAAQDIQNTLNALKRTQSYDGSKKSDYTVKQQNTIVTIEGDIRNALKNVRAGGFIHQETLQTIFTDKQFNLISPLSTPIVTISLDQLIEMVVHNVKEVMQCIPPEAREKFIEEVLVRIRQEEFSSKENVNKSENIESQSVGTSKFTLWPG